jgi:hypothetical protein
MIVIIILLIAVIILAIPVIRICRILGAYTPYEMENMDDNYVSDFTNEQPRKGFINGLSIAAIMLIALIISSCHVQRYHWGEAERVQYMKCLNGEMTKEKCDSCFHTIYWIPVMFFCFLLLPLNSYSQGTVSQDLFESIQPGDTIIQPKITKGWKVVSIYSASIILNAMGDAYNHSDRKQLGHMLNGLSIGVLVTTAPFIKYNTKGLHILKYPEKYVFLRIFYFDPVYNLTRGLPITYYGNTSTWDKMVMQKIKPPDGLMMLRGVFFIAGISVPLTHP